MSTNLRHEGIRVDLVWLVSKPTIESARVALEYRVATDRCRVWAGDEHSWQRMIIFPLANAWSREGCTELGVSWIHWFFPSQDPSLFFQVVQNCGVTHYGIIGSDEPSYIPQVLRNAHLSFYDEQEAALKGGGGTGTCHVILKAGLIFLHETVIFRNSHSFAALVSLVGHIDSILKNLVKQQTKNRSRWNQLAFLFFEIPGNGEMIQTDLFQPWIGELNHQVWWESVKGKFAILKPFRRGPKLCPVYCYTKTRSTRIHQPYQPNDGAPPKVQHDIEPWKYDPGIGVSFWKLSFLGSMLKLGMVVLVGCFFSTYLSRIPKDYKWSVQVFKVCCCLHWLFESLHASPKKTKVLWNLK